MRKFIFFGIILIASVACTQKLEHHAEKPDDLIPKDTMVGMFTDFRLMDAALLHEQKNRKKNIDDTELYMYTSILEKYHVSRERFEQSFDYYATDLNEFDEIYAEVITRLSKLKAEIEEQ